MPKLEKDLWIEGGYYIDFDELGQFRIIGPNNHLYCGLIDIPRHKIGIKKIYSEKGGARLVILAEFFTSQINLYYPAQEDIRTMRQLLHPKQDLRKNFISFLEARRLYFDAFIPREISHQKLKNKNILSFLRRYEENKYYSVNFEFDKNIEIKDINKPYKGHKLTSAKKQIPFKIIAETNDTTIKCKIKNLFLPQDFDFKVFGKEAKIVKKFLERTKIEIEHLITWGKTSGDRFGTIFPRDWMESADLGVHDLTEEARDYMYQVSLKNINEKGESWHEDVVGEYKYEHEISGRDLLDRHMIDIEPHHLFGLKVLSQDFLVDSANREKLKRIAQYILKQTQRNDLITFKRIPKEKEKDGFGGYYLSGNWRDSRWAYKKIHPIVAPFDVNAVFYPAALETIKSFQKSLGIKVKNIDKLIAKWQKIKNLYSFKNKEDGLPAYALTLYDIKKSGKKFQFKKLKVNHLDESYFFTYLDGSKKEIESFCKRLLSPEYFYTPSGPLLIAKNNPCGYTTAEYHGLVIWTKQTAFVILGLSRHLKRAIAESWPKPLQKLIKKTLLVICQNTIKTFAKLGSIPELHYDNGTGPKHFTNQPEVSAVASRVQLWSAIGARRIFRKYYELITEKHYKI